MGHSKLGKKYGQGTGFYGAVIENADYLMDIEISKERKKRVRVDVEDSRWDKTYVSFLVDLENYLDAKFGEENDEEDPIYAAYLEHLMENGKGYMLRDSVEHGVTIPIIYEVETPKKKSPITRQSSKTRKESHGKGSNFADQVKTDSPDTVKRYNTRSCQGANIPKKGSVNDNKKLKSTPKSSEFDTAIQIDPSIVIKKEIYRNCEHYNLRKPSNVVKSGIKNTKAVNVEAEAHSLDEINKETSRNDGHYNLRKTRNVEAKAPLKPVIKNSKTVNEVEASSSDETNKETSGTRHAYSLRKRSGLQADKQIKPSLKKCKVEKDPLDVIDLEPLSLDEISRETSRTRSGYNMRKRSGLEADKQLRPGLKKCQVEKDPVNVIEAEANSLDEISRESSGTRSGYSMRKRSKLEADKKLKPGLKECQVEKDPLKLNDGPPVSHEGSVNRELKSSPTNSVFVNKKEGDPSQVIERNTLRTQPDVNIQKKGDLPTDRKVKPGRVSQGKGSHEHDEAYKAFLDGLKFSGDLMVYEYADRQKIFYEVSAQHISSDDDDEAEATKACPSSSTRSPEIPTPCPRPSTKTEPIIILTPQSPIVTPTPQSPPVTPTVTPTPLSKTDPILTMTPLSPIVTPTPQSPPVTSTVTPTPLSPPVTSTVTPTPLSPTVHHNRDKASDKIRKASQQKRLLWNQLHQILGKPFDKNQFDELSREMNRRSEVQVYRESRSGGTYKPGQMGQSYLDTYPELKREIEEVKSDSCKVLNLLRMLSFYLTNVPHGIPRPWLPDHRKEFLP